MYIIRVFTLCFAFIIPFLPFSNEHIVSNSLAFKNTEIIESSKKSNSFQQGTTLDNNLEYTIISNKNTIIDNLTSNSTFSIDGNVEYDGKQIPINEYFAFSSFNKFDIAEWLKNINVLTNDDLFNVYHSLIEKRVFNNIECLNAYQQRYYELCQHMNYDLGKEHNPFEPNIRSKATLNGTHFTIEYESPSISQTDANSLLLCLENAYSIFITSHDFSEPIPESGLSKIRVSLETGEDPDGNAIAVTIPHFFAFNSNKRRCEIVFYEFQTFTYAKGQTAAHEFFHCIQFAYNASYTWISEAFADWAKFFVYGYSGFHDRAINFINSSLPLNSTLNNINYGAMLYPLTLYKDYGGVAAIREFYNVYEGFYYTLSDENLYSDVIIDTLENLGYEDDFADTFKKMAGYLYKPESFFSSYNGSQYWSNTNETYINLSYNNTQTSSVTLDTLCRKYYTITIPDNFYGRINVQVTTTNSGSFVAIRNWNNSYSIVEPTKNGSIYTHSFIKNSIHEDLDFGFVIYNPSPYLSSSISISVQLVNTSGNITFDNYTRYYESVLNMAQLDCYKFEMSYSRTGALVMQTMGNLDTIIRITNASGTELDYSDDDGYNHNAFIKYQFSANTTYYIYVRCWSSSYSGTTKLVIMPSDSYNTNYSTGISSFSDIYNFNISNGNVRYMTNQQYQVRMVTFTPSTTMNYYISTGGDEDTYLYIINPSSSSLLVEDVDYTDEEGEDGDGNAGLTKYLTSGTTYLIVVSLYTIPDTGSFSLCIYPSYW